MMGRSDCCNCLQMLSCACAGGSTGYLRSDGVALSNVANAGADQNRLVENGRGKQDYLYSGQDDVYPQSRKIEHRAMQIRSQTSETKKEYQFM